MQTHLLVHVQLPYTRAVEDLHRNLVAGELVLGEPHFAERSDAEVLAQSIVADPLQVGRRHRCRHHVKVLSGRVEISSAKV